MRYISAICGKQLTARGSARESRTTTESHHERTAGPRGAAPSSSFHSKDATGGEQGLAHLSPLRELCTRHQSGLGICTVYAGALHPAGHGCSVPALGRASYTDLYQMHSGSGGSVSWSFYNTTCSVLHRNENGGINSKPVTCPIEMFNYSININ